MATPNAQLPTPKTFGIRVIDSRDASAVQKLLAPVRRPAETVEKAVATIIADVRERGDDAVLEYARRFDGLDGPVELSVSDLRRGARAVPTSAREAVRLAARNIRAVARSQVPRSWTTRTASGVRVDQRVMPLHRAGCYVPAGRYPLPSSLLMAAIPARVAGVGEVVVACPRPDAMIMFAALEAGVDRVLRLGGAHAIAAMAYGTQRVPRVDKIVGPGNAYVAAAKAQVSRHCAIDFFAGPSEIVVISRTGRPDWIAADLIAQAEHDVDARAILLTPSRDLALAVAAECRRRLPVAGTAAEALKRNGGIVVTASEDEAVVLSEQMAPEHVVCDNRRIAARLTRAGTIFVGRLSAQALGDYVTGSNHVLPTSGAARARGGLSAADFVRITSVQTITAEGLRRIGPAGVTLARAEGLTAHASSIDIRMGGA